MTKKLIRLIPLTCDYLAATRRGKKDLTIHAVKWVAKPPYEAVCGEEVPKLSLYGVRMDTNLGPGIRAMPWPPPIKKFGPRCPACWHDTGRKRPDPSWKTILDG